jgi:hypothetical protein
MKRLLSIALALLAASSAATAEPIKRGSSSTTSRGLCQGFLATSLARADRSDVRCILNDEDLRRVSETCRPDALCEVDALLREDVDEDDAAVTKVVSVRSFAPLKAKCLGRVSPGESYQIGVTAIRIGPYAIKPPKCDVDTSPYNMQLLKSSGCDVEGVECLIEGRVSKRPNDKGLLNDVINLGYVPVGYLDGAKRVK